jgi:hypothetical protein
MLPVLVAALSERCRLLIFQCNWMFISAGGDRTLLYAACTSGSSEREVSIIEISV